MLSRYGALRVAASTAAIASGMFAATATAEAQVDRLVIAMGMPSAESNLFLGDGR